MRWRWNEESNEVEERNGECWFMEGGRNFVGTREERFCSLCPKLEELEKNMIGELQRNFNFC